MICKWSSPERELQAAFLLQERAHLKLTPPQWSTPTPLTSNKGGIENSKGRQVQESLPLGNERRDSPNRRINFSGLGATTKWTFIMHKIEEKWHDWGSSSPNPF
jgi:hypothetical protein